MFLSQLVIAEVQQGVVARPRYVYTNNIIILTLTDDLFIAISHLRYLETVDDQLEMRLKAAKTEVHPLRNVSEALMLSTTMHAVAVPPRRLF